MFRAFFNIFFASMRISRNLNHIRVGTDAAYRDAVMAELDRAAAGARRAETDQAVGTLPYPV